MRQTCLKTVFELAKKNKKVLFVGSDLGPGVLNEFKEKFPNRFFMEGGSLRLYSPTNYFSKKKISFYQFQLSLQI